MFYHVIIELKENNKRIFELDIETREELLSDYISPYLNNENFNFAGRDLIKKEITSIIIRNSDHDSFALQKLTRKINIVGEEYNVYDRESVVEFDGYSKDITRIILNEAKNLLNENQNVMTDNVSVSVDKTKVFIVHGHDNEAKSEVARFIERLGLEAIILHEQANAGATIIQKLENYSNVGFGIVLYTPCDVGAKQGTKRNKFSPRARQNVVFEHGFLVGKLKRDNVCFLVKDDVEIPNDISGGVYIKLDEYGGWKDGLMKELENADYNIDRNKVR